MQNSGYAGEHLGCGCVVAGRVVGGLVVEVVAILTVIWSFFIKMSNNTNRLYQTCLEYSP